MFFVFATISMVLDELYFCFVHAFVVSACMHVCICDCTLKVRKFVNTISYKPAKGISQNLQILCTWRLIRF